MKDTTAEWRHFARLADAEPLLIAHASGSYVYDVDGRRYIDFESGWCCGNLGWSLPLEAIEAFRGPAYVSPSYAYERWVELAEILADITPGRLTKCFRATGGSEAVDLAMQAAMLHTNRDRFVALEGSYHGNTLATLSLNGDRAVLRCKQVDLDLDQIERALKRRDVAAFIMEPIVVARAVEIPPADFMESLAALCRRYGTLLIMDEVATGFGRTGRMFGTEHYAIDPDIMCLAKGLSGGGAAIGATVMTAPVARSMQNHGVYYSTYGWHPLSVAVALANVRYMLRHETELFAHVADMSALFEERLRQMKLARAVRVKGMLIAVDVEDEQTAARIEKRCRKNGLLLNVDGATLVMMPALNIDERVVEHGLDILAAAASTRG